MPSSQKFDSTYIDELPMLTLFIFISMSFVHLVYICTYTLVQNKIERSSKQRFHSFLEIEEFSKLRCMQKFSI